MAAGDIAAEHDRLVPVDDEKQTHRPGVFAGEDYTAFCHAGTVSGSIADGRKASEQIRRYVSAYVRKTPLHLNIRGFRSKVKKIRSKRMMYVKWITLQVTEMEASKNFYGQFLGLGEQRLFSPAPGKTICFLGDDNDMQIELICYDTAKGTVPHSTANIGICADNYGEMYQKSKERGAVLAEPAVMGGNLHWFFISDPDGTRLQIIKNKKRLKKRGNLMRRNGSPMESMGWSSEQAMAAL